MRLHVAGVTIIFGRDDGHQRLEKLMATINERLAGLKAQGDSLELKFVTLIDVLTANGSPQTAAQIAELEQNMADAHTQVDSVLAALVPPAG